MTHEDAQPLPPPSHCPFCDSPAIVPGGKVTTSTYWRCDTCLEVWNPDRLPRSVVRHEPPIGFRRFRSQS